MTKRTAAGLWPDLFTGLTMSQRAAVLRNLTWSMPDENEPSREEVSDMVRYVTGELTNAEYARRCSRRDSARTAQTVLIPSLKLPGASTAMTHTDRTGLVPDGMPAGASRPTKWAPRRPLRGP
ncbi:hypothetical protein [Nocardioides sp. PD653]|uniref:hypothetical protein n=1 Tax=Nocardioides sp. PD653 TaxID=393303 RepID=UPI0009F075E7|nr:hypothetical protein [Nocardioides sp. PD653]GAW54771.1 uncharacterized protein PD653_2185 [Nocardioides sp. PD653]